MSVGNGNGRTFDRRICRLAVARLTQTEHEILLLIADGKMDKEISAERGISNATVDFHKSNVFRTLGVHSRVEAVRVALAAGVV